MNAQQIIEILKGVKADLAKLAERDRNTHQLGYSAFYVKPKSWKALTAQVTSENPFAAPAGWETA